ncbi:MAG TPA: hypothetical protein EYQ73_03520 [Candidatus Poseidoniales archaeon]|nr:hypothetical protein [Candidatus Poseidoniales archaeon]HIL64567.1 hypothetical protein [Candidatus Poseidoniales archaeon]
MLIMLTTERGGFLCFTYHTDTMRRVLVVALLLLAMVPATPVAAEGGIVIEEILASASGKDYNGTDWNGDGDIGNPSDQYIMLTNTGSADVDISDWILDDRTDGGSPPCRIGWNTTIGAGESITFYRANTRIAFDYFDADAATLSDASGNVIDSMAYPAEDSWWDKAYVWADNGTLWKTDPNPADRQGTCFTPRDHIHEGSYILQGRVVTMTGQNEVIENGNILITDGDISAVWADGEIPPMNTDGIEVHDTNATIYPGLIDMHNHMHYNTAPLWEMSPHTSSQTNEFGGYENRYQWKNHPDYKYQVTKPKMFVQSGSYWNMESQSMKYVEAKEIVGGTTSAQGGPSTGEDSFDSILSRNIEYWNFGADEIHTKVTELESDYQGNHIINGNQSGELRAWFLHLAEGMDESSRAEFDILVNNNLLVGEVIIIHGTALTSNEFNAMGQVGASLAWSPLSNLLLYGTTTDVAAAKAAGVRINIAPDWSPSGSKSPLHELKVADLWDDEILGDIFSDYEMVQMVTSNPAKSMKWDQFVGTIEAGKAADLVVLDTIDTDPYRNMINAIDPDVRLTVVGGLPLYGDADLMTALKGTDHEPVGMGKVIDVTFSGVEDGTQTWASIVSDLEMAMKFDYDEMNSIFGANHDDFDNQVSGMVEVGLDPVHTYGDDRYFDVINNSNSANAQIDMSLLYDRYYDRAENIGVSTSINLNNVATQTNYDIVINPSERNLQHGILMTNCSSTSTALPAVGEDEVLVCGALDVLVEEPTACFVEVGTDLIWNDPCPEGTTWADEHQGISENPVGDIMVSRMDPSYQRGDAIAFPGVLCDGDTVQFNVVSSTITVTKADQLSGWTCVDSWQLIDLSPDVIVDPIIDDTPDENETEQPCVGICDDTNDKTQGESEKTDPIIMLSIVMGVIVLGAIAVMIFSREGKPEVVETELADEIELSSELSEKQFVPELPPMKPPE